MSTAPSPQSDPISALMRRLAVLLAGLLGSILADLLAERDGLPAGDARRAAVMRRIVAVRRLQALAAEHASPPENAAVELVLMPAPWRLLHSLRLGCRVARGAHTLAMRGDRLHPRPLHPPNPRLAGPAREATARKAALARAHSP